MCVCGGGPVTQEQVKRGGFVNRGKVFFHVCFGECVGEIKWLLYTNGAPYRVDQLRRTASMWRRRRLGEKILFLSPDWWDKRNLPPGGQCATVKSSLQSIHIAEVLFDFYKKIRYNSGQRGLKPAVLAGTGQRRSGRGVVCLSGCGSRSVEVPRGVVVARQKGSGAVQHGEV